MRAKERMTEAIQLALLERDSTIRLWAMTFLGVALESIVGTAFVLNAAGSWLRIEYPYANNVLQNIIPSATLSLLLVYVFIPIPYCFAASRSFHPKRLVSPLNIQMFSVVISVAAYIADFIAVTGSYYIPSFNLGTFISNTTAVGLFLGTIFLVIGFFQTQVVKFLVGLNGTTDDIDLKAWSVAAPFAKISEFLNDDLMSHYDMKVLKRSQELLLARAYISENKQRVVLAIAPNTKDPSKSIIAVAGYGQGYYAVYRLDSASQKRDRIAKDVQYRLKESNLSPDFFDSPLPTTSDSASEAVRNYSLSPTEAGSSALTRVRSSVIITVGLPVTAFILLSVPWYLGLIPTDLFGGAITFYAFTLLTIYYPEIKERYSVRKEVGVN